MRNIEKNCLHGVERQNMFANLIGQEKYVCREVRQDVKNIIAKTEIKKN